MNRIKSLNRYQKGLLIVMMVMVIAFGAIYFVTISRAGFPYGTAILIPKQENGNTVYTGKIEGQPAQITVSADKTVVFRYGEKIYGPYTAREDPTAIKGLPKGMTGVEILQGDSVFFRGGVDEENDILYSEDGTIIRPRVISISGAVMRDENGKIIDQMEPSVFAILDLMNGPELVHRGSWLVWFLAVFACVINALMILFADEYFRWGLRFRIRNAEDAEPTEWEIADRYIGWTAFTGIALLIFILGLR